MSRKWAVLAAIAASASVSAKAQPAPPAPDGAQHVLCDDYKAVEQAALQDFVPIAGKFSHLGPLIRMAPTFIAPPLAAAKLVLPDANSCDIRASGLNLGKNAYSCLWRSEQPDFAAADQAKRIAFCLDADVTKSDFSTDLTVVTQAKVRFRLTSEHHYDGLDGYAVRLVVDGPQFKPD